MNKDKLPLTIIRQEFLATVLSVPAASAVPLSQAAQQTALTFMYETWEVCVPASAGNSVWWGSSSINPASFNGREIVPGTSANYRVINERQLYEIQGPLVDRDCSFVPEVIPFHAWDVTTIYLRAAGAVAISVGVILFKGILYK